MITLLIASVKVSIPLCIEGKDDHVAREASNMKPSMSEDSSTANARSSCSCATTS